MDHSIKYDSGKLEILSMGKSDGLKLIYPENRMVAAAIFDGNYIYAVNIGRYLCHAFDIVDITEHGAKKYGIGNYRHNMQWSRIVNAGLRHLRHERTVIDTDSGLPHGASAYWNACCLEMFARTKTGVNDLQR